MIEWLEKHTIIRKLVRIAMWVVIAIFATLSLTIGAFYVWTEMSRNSLVHAVIPTEFEVARTIFRKGEFWGLCGVGMYELPPHIISRIEQEGLDFLNTATSANFADKESHYYEWEKTPIDLYGENYGESWWAVPPSCAKLSKVKQHQIYEALQTSGNYYAFMKNGPFALIVLPKSRRLMVFYFEL